MLQVDGRLSPMIPYEYTCCIASNNVLCYNEIKKFTEIHFFRHRKYLVRCDTDVRQNKTRLKKLNDLLDVILSNKDSI